MASEPTKNPPAAHKRFKPTPAARVRPYGTARGIFDDGSDICLDVRVAKRDERGHAAVIEQRDWLGGYSEYVPLVGAKHARDLAALLLRAADTLERRGFE